MPDLELPGQRHDSLPLSQYESDDESDHDRELDEIPDVGSLEDQRASSRSPSPDLPSTPD
jgi:hypothetical protein